MPGGGDNTKRLASAREEVGSLERGFLEAALDSIVVIDATGCVVEFNASATETFGYSRDEALGRTLAELIIPPSLQVLHKQAFERFVETREKRLFGQRLELTGMRSDGSEFPVELALSQVEGEPLLICGAIRDISKETQLKQDLQRLADEQAALRHVATLVAQGASPGQVFSAVAQGVALVLGVPGINMIRFDQESAAIKIAGWGTSPLDVGSRWNLDDPSVMALIAREVRPARIESYEETGGEFSKIALSAGIRSGIGAPILVDGAAWGAIIAYSAGPERFNDDAESRLLRFTELMATAISNVQARDRLHASRARIVTAGDEARRRIQRDLHDGAQQRIVASVIDLQLADERFESDPESARKRVRSALQSLEAGLEELRELAAGLHPRILTRGGLHPALDALAVRCQVPVTIAVSTSRYPSQLEAAAYFVVAEALANVAKHAQARRAKVEVEETDGDLLISIEDDGVGGADPSNGTGLRGLADRAEALGGQLRVQSVVGSGTLLTASLPLVYA